MSSVSNIPLSSLLERIKRGEGRDEAFLELVERYTPLVNKKVSMYFSGSADVAEATQEARIALHSAAVSYDEERCEGVTFGLYAGVCIANRLKSFLRLRRRDSERSEQILRDEPCVLSDVDGFLARRELYERVMRIAKSVLSELEFSVFKLSIDGYSTKDIASRLSREPKSVDNAKARISKRLKANSEICSVLSEIL